MLIDFCTFAVKSVRQVSGGNERHKAGQDLTSLSSVELSLIKRHC